ncbi:hypothetical protein GCM10022409_38110 [Hymenobacter glaciei]|uniref:Polysaccharide chain length determinant N-terminal domain-containing protein n=1 Tax=Hymenobacter glaciei TaxID=877209 RepID=A0ABP7UN50_9BACT
MSVPELFRLLARKWALLLLVPLVLGASTWFFARELPTAYSSDTTIYTGIASGYSLAGNASADYNATNNAFDNLTNLITARSTKQEVLCRLLAQDLWDTRQHPEYLPLSRYEDLREGLPATQRQQLTASTLEATQEAVRTMAEADNSNAVRKLLDAKNATYSLNALKKLTATHLGFSDLIKVEFESHDPELCQNTLSLVTQVFLSQSKNLRESQTTSVIAYYETELKRAKERLDKAESENLAFNRANNIINYDAQSQNVATEKEALATQLTETNQQYAGAMAALRAVNGKLGSQQSAILSSREVVEQRRKLSQVNASLADQQLFGQQNAEGTAKARQLQAEADAAAQAIQNNVNTYYAQSNTPGGIPNKDLLGEWVQNMVLVESNKAKLAVMDRRRDEFEREYQRMAPLGASLKRIAREIDLAEKNYLAVLANLNASKATQQNTQLTANLKIVDQPNLPAQPKSNPLLLLLLLSTIGGLVLTAGTVAGLGLLDRTLQTPEKASRQTGLPVAGLLLANHAAPTARQQELQQRSLEQLARYLLLKSNTTTAPGPFLVGIGSVQGQEGKTTLCQALATCCHTMGMSVMALYPAGTDGLATGEVPTLYYPAETAAVQAWPLEQLLVHATPRQPAGQPLPKVVLVEFPALREGALPVGLLRQLGQVFLTVSATRAWRPADRQAVDQLRAATPAPIEMVLTGVTEAHAQEAIS